MKLSLPGREVEHYPVALTVEAVALGWLRQRAAPHGAVVVADVEVAPRTRRGDPWPAPGALRAAVVVRPELAAEAADVLWAHALLAAASACDAAPWWPDGVRRRGADVGSVRVASQLGPGRVESAVLTFRLRGGDREALLAGLVGRLDDVLGRPPESVVAAYRTADPLAGRAVRVNLLPRGTVRGTARSIDASGAYAVEGATGRPRLLAVDSIAGMAIDV